MSFVECTVGGPQQYVYAAVVMYEGLEEILAGGNEKIQQGSLEQAQRLFSVAVDQIRRDRTHNYKSEIHILEGLSTHRMIADILRKVSDKPITTRQEVDSEIELLAEAMQNPGPLFLRHKREEYEMLTKFFKELYKIGANARYEETVRGTQSPYGWTI